MSYVRLVICNRCGRQLVDAHPDRITIHKHEFEPYTTYFKEEKVKSVYKTHQSLHLCDECSSAFSHFLKNEPLYSDVVKMSEPTNDPI